MKVRLDGSEATQRIRAWPDFAELPIIAMTAHAMAEARVHCYEVGMNEHLVKPIEPESLYATVARLARRPESAASAAVISVASPLENPGHAPLPPLASIEIPGVDVATALRRLGGREALYLRTLSHFLTRGVGSADDIADSLAAADSVSAVRHAHTAKGVLGYVGADHAQVLAARLEKALGGGGESASVDSLLSEFRAALASLASHLEPLVKARVAA